MSYNCSGVNATRRNHYSNTNNTYDGRPTGSAGEDNSRTLNDLRFVYQAYRPAVVSQAPGAPTDIQTLALSTDFVQLGWTLADQLESNVVVIRDSAIIATLPAGTT